jgi:hypothetical protein
MLSWRRDVGGATLTIFFASVCEPSSGHSPQTLQDVGEHPGVTIDWDRLLASVDAD